MTPQELKNSILQLAIQGKLVEQRPEEGTAAELLEKILAAKNAEGRGRKLTRSRGVRGGGETEVLNVANVQQLPISNTSFQLGNEERGMRKLGIGNNGNGNISTLATLKNLSALSASPREEIPDDEKPFEIPESWEWVRLGDCTSYAAKKEKVLSTDIRPDEWSLDLEDIEKDTGRIIEFRSAKDRRIVGEKVVFHKGQILYSKLRPYLKKILVAPKDGICTPELVPFSALGGIDANYLVDVLMSPHVDFAINSVTYGVKMPRVGTDTMVNLLIPLPPLAEQKRIVAKIEELLPLIDRYEKAWSRLEDFNKRFPVDMQKSLLQMAIQGKLVEQRPEEGTGEELYRQIQAEKQRLIKSGKIKKEKPLPAITEDEIPFEIPDSWKWARLSKIAKAIVDCPHSTPKYLNLETEYCTIDTNCINEKGEIIKWRYVDAGTYQVRIARLVPHKDDIVYTREGSICRAAQLPDNKNICLGQRVMLVRCANGMFPQFLRRMLMSPAVITKLTEQQKGIGAKHVNVSDVCSLTLPLPPLAEQKRIVAKLEELLPLCERLK